MVEGLPNRVFVEWARYYSTEPFGEIRADARMAVLASLMANSWLRGKGQPQFEPPQFMPTFGPQKTKEKTPDEMLELVIGIHKAYGGTVTYAGNDPAS